MATPQWIKKLGGHAGELYVAAELSKRGIPNSLLPENFSDDDILAGNKAGTELCYIQVKACHPDRSHSFLLNESNEGWINSPANQFVVFVWLGSPKENQSPRYWIAAKKEVGEACIQHGAHGTSDKARRFTVEKLNKNWENNWEVFRKYMP